MVSRLGSQMRNFGANCFFGRYWDNDCGQILDRRDFLGLLAGSCRSRIGLEWALAGSDRIPCCKTLEGCILSSLGFRRASYHVDF